MKPGTFIPIQDEHCRWYAIEVLAGPFATQAQARHECEEQEEDAKEAFQRAIRAVQPLGNPKWEDTEI